MIIRLKTRYGHFAGACLCHGAEARRVVCTMEDALSRRAVLKGVTATLAAGALGQATPLAAEAPATIVLANARIFDGVSAGLIDGRDVAIAGGRIAALIPRGEAVEDAQVIDCAGKVIMPGLIDAHWHSFMAALPQAVAMTADAAYIHLLAVQEAGRTLLRGFTSVRDVGGPTFALKRAVDEGRFPGPRIFPSGAMISQTAGHGDFRFRSQIPSAPAAPLSPAEKEGIAIIADGVPEVLKRAREQLLLGASQLKIMVGGGVSSLYDPLDSIQFTAPEIRAAVDAASDWGTYVCAHVYTPEGIERALACGVKSIEHGQLADAQTAKHIADAGAWWSLQPFLADEDANPQSTPEQQAQQKAIAEGTVRAFELARQYDVNVAIGTDILFSPAKTATQGRQIAKLARWMSNVDVLRLATSRNAALLALSGARNPYPGNLGLIEARAHADLLVVDGNPLEDIGIIGDPERRMQLIMKAGIVYKNTLAA
ncbi:imidazolonepropionase-like amidohydrolase [Pseudochelatococcus lubricantis]|uniref:Imidazolonepropionase-like amidohydrolase n=1 Tax=Pseudochelatococcus lubricantis TaxID=1538102 RepID=A0ABX0V091_9HYPH|nr:amidohydrolase family protein [Pseudochelatococcus lubricantis]NIJ57665.1 imidazolonepropionase-like amidohydrolase [Pseudochelatococcus lubricantis]